MRTAALLLAALSYLLLASAALAAEEQLPAPAAGKQPHIMMVLLDDFGWADAGWHRNYSIGGVRVDATDEVQTPHLNGLVREGIELDRAYVYKW